MQSVTSFLFGCIEQCQKKSIDEMSLLVDTLSAEATEIPE
jgi:hypothetical protein